MTLEERLKAAQERWKRRNDPDEDELSAGEVAEEVLTKGIPSLITGPLSLLSGLAEAVHSPTAFGDRAGKAVEEYAYDRWNNPSHALPEVGMIAGGALGALVGMPNVGAGAGALVGTAARNALKDTPWTKEDVSGVLMAPLGNLPFAMTGAAIRTARGTGKKTTQGETIFKSHRFTPEQIDAADLIMDEAKALSDARREAAHFTKPKAVLAKHDPQPSPFPPKTEEQLELFPKQDSLAQLPLFDKSRLGPRQSRPAPETVSAPGPEQAGPGQLDLFRATFFEQPELFKSSDRFAQHALFNTDRLSGRASAQRALSPEEAAVLYDKNDPAQLELFRPPEFDQPELFPAPDRFAQPVLFKTKGRHAKREAEEGAPPVTGGWEKKEQRERFRQGTLLPEHDRFRQLDLFRAEKHKGRVDPVDDVDAQLELPLSRRLQPAPEVSTGPDWEPTGLYRVTPDQYEQQDLQLSRRAQPAPEIDQGPGWTPTRLVSVKKDKAEQGELDLSSPKAAPVIDQGQDWNATRLVTIKNDRMAQSKLFPAKRNSPHWLTGWTREQRRTALVAGAKAKIASHVAEKEARLIAEKQRATDPLVDNLHQDEQYLARLTALEPQHLQSDTNPYVTEMRKAGFMASAFNPHMTLNKLGPHGYWLSQNTVAARDLYDTAVSHMQQRAHRTMDKYNVQENDLTTHGLVYVLEEHPDLHDMLRTGGTRAIKQWEQATGNRLNVRPQDYKRLVELGKFRDEFRESLLAPMWNFGLKRNADPKVMATYNTRYVFPTFTGRRVAAEVEDSLGSIRKALDSLSESEKGEAHGKLLQAQHDALARKLRIATKAADEQDVSRARGAQTLYKPGMKIGEVFSPAYKDKHTDMLFGVGMRSSVDDYIRGFVKKAVYDPMMNRANDVIRAAPFDPATKAWATAYTLDQLGTRRQTQLRRMTDKLKQVPGLGKHIKDDSLDNAISNVGKFKAAIDLGLNPKFYPMNASQLLITGAGLVGHDGLAYGIMKATTDWPTVYKEAVRDGAVQSGLEHMWNEVGSSSRGHRVTRFVPAALDKALLGLQASEALNRTIIDQAGKFVAKKEGLTGRDAVRRARDINRMANFGFSPADRPTATGTATGSVLLRYKSFGAQQLSYINHMMKTNPKAAAETLTMLIALGGTAAIPLFGLAQDQLAKAGINIPNFSPLDEATGFDLGNSFSILPDIPGSDGTIASAAGPFLSPAVKGAQALMEGESGAVGAAAGAFLGSPMRAARSLDEYLRGGMTTTASGKPLIQRRGKDIALTALNLKQGPRAQAWKLKDAIMKAHEAGDSAGLKTALVKAREGGLINPGSAVSTAKRMKKKEENKKGFFDMLMQR